eukprot:gene5040-3596_t
MCSTAQAIKGPRKSLSSVKFLTPVMWMSLTRYFWAMKHCLPP